MWRPFGPTTSSTSASINSCSTPSPTPTLSASSPSFAAPASSPSASRTRSGSSSRHSLSGATGAADTVPITVGPPVLVGLGSHPSRSQSDRTRREDRRLKIYGLRDNLGRSGLKVSELTYGNWVTHG